MSESCGPKKARPCRKKSECSSKCPNASHAWAAISASSPEIPLAHSRSYSSLVYDGTRTVQGNGWFTSSLPYIAFCPTDDSDPTKEEPHQLVFVRGVDDTVYFKRQKLPLLNKFEWKALFGETRYGLVRVKGKIPLVIITDTISGIQWEFTGNENIVTESAGVLRAIRWQRPKKTLTTEINYVHGKRLIASIKTIYRYDAGIVKENATSEMIFDYGEKDLLNEVILVVNGEAKAKEIYRYYSDGEIGGGECDLAEAIAWKSEPTGSPTDTYVYRYYKEGEAGGFAHALKFEFSPEDTRRASIAGYDLRYVPDEIARRFSSAYYEYGLDKKVSGHWIDGGSKKISINNLFNEANPHLDDVSTWSRRSEITMPDGEKKVTYYISDGSPLLSSRTSSDGGDAQWNYYRYNSDHRLTEKVYASAISTVNEPTSSDGTLSVNLHSDLGRIDVIDYYSTNDYTNGEVEGWIRRTGVRKGENGNNIWKEKTLYETRTVDGSSIHLPSEIFTYTEAGMSDNDAPKISYVRTYFEDPITGEPLLGVESETKTLPAIPVSQNGTGIGDSTVVFFDVRGNPEWIRDSRGVITYRRYDIGATGALVQQVDDVDTTTMSGVPDGWNTPAGGGKNLITNIEVDGRGRPLRSYGPVHEVQLNPCDDEPTKVRSVTFNVYVDEEFETRTARGYQIVSTQGAPQCFVTVGPVLILRTDANGNLVDQIATARRCVHGPLCHSEYYPQSSWVRWIHFVNDDYGRELEKRVYHKIPKRGSGAEGVNYDSTRSGYSENGRENRTVTPGGTISRTVADVQGRVVSIWVGTNDAGATDSDPTGGGSVGNNLVKTYSFEYDLDGNLTKETRPTSDNSAEDQITTHTYDFQDRRETSSSSDGQGNTYITKNTFDNLGRLTQVDDYHTVEDAGNLTGRRKNYYDNQGRAFKNETYSVGSDGSIGNAIDSQTWYDPVGNILKQTVAGQTSAAKINYDSLQRVEASYLVVPGTSEPSAGDVSDDIVIEQSEMFYDDASNPIFEISYIRLPESSGKGKLGGPLAPQPQARRSYSAAWPGPTGRIYVVAEFGTNGGAELSRPEIAPTPSDTVLVSSASFDPDTGDVIARVSPDGTVTRLGYDDAGRNTVVVENYLNLGCCERCPNDSDANRERRLTFAPDGGVATLTLVNPITGAQRTTWSYGTNLDTSGVATSNLASGRTSPGGHSSELTYNRRGQVSTLTTSSGTTHSYDRDLFDRLIHDRVTTLGPEIDESVLRISLEYNNRGQLVRASNYDDSIVGQGSIVNQVELIYSGLGCLIKDKQEHFGAINANTPEVTYTCTNGTEGIQRRTSVVYPSGRQLDIEYGTSGSIDDSLNRVASLNDFDLTILAEMQYAGASAVAKISYPEPGAALNLTGNTGDGGDSLSGYDRFGRLVCSPWKSSVATLSENQYGFDRASRIRYINDLTPAAAGEQDLYYLYDNLGQIKMAERGTVNTSRDAIGGIPLSAESFDYDPQGNWMAYGMDREGAPKIAQARVHNTENRITQVNDSSKNLAYNANGEMTLVPTGDDLGGDPRLLKWNPWGYLVEVRDFQGNLLQRNQYDSLGRRTTRSDGVDIYHLYYNDLWRVVEQRKNSTSNPHRQYVWHPSDRNTLILRDTATIDDGSLDQRFYLLKNNLDPAAIIDDSGVVKERYEFTSFGRPSYLAPDYSSRASSSYDWDILFHSEMSDPETGWQNYGFRFYLPEIGRWPNEDPIGDAGNLYAFTGNRVVNTGDYLGLFTAAEIKEWEIQLRLRRRETSVGKAIGIEVGGTMERAGGQEDSIPMAGGEIAPISGECCGCQLTWDIDELWKGTFQGGDPPSTTSGVYIRARHSAISGGNCDCDDDNKRIIQFVRTTDSGGLGLADKGWRNSLSWVPDAKDVKALNDSKNIGFFRFDSSEFDPNFFLDQIGFDVGEFSLRITSGTGFIETPGISKEEDGLELLTCITCKVGGKRSILGCMSWAFRVKRPNKTPFVIVKPDIECGSSNRLQIFARGIGRQWNAHKSVFIDEDGSQRERRREKFLIDSTIGIPQIEIPEK